MFHKPGSRNDTSIAITWVMPDSMNMGTVFKNVAEDLMSYAPSEGQLYNC